jgi:hypothetical protein
LRTKVIVLLLCAATAGCPALKPDDDFGDLGSPSGPPVIVTGPTLDGSSASSDARTSADAGPDASGPLLDATTKDAATAPDAVAPIDAAAPDAIVPDASPPPDASITACYRCSLSAGACSIDMTSPDAGGCASGYQPTMPDCRPCWSCSVSNAYCPDLGCCGSYTTTGVVGPGCTCYGCSGFANDFDQATSCANAKMWSHSGGPSPNITCPYPSGGETAFCGYYVDTCSCSITSCGGACTP